VPEGQLLPAPEGIGLIDAAGVVEAAATVVSNLVLEAGLREGETVLVHGGTGGIGTVAIQLATQMESRVLTTVGSDEALPVVAQLGAEQAWNRRIIDLPAAVREAGGADVILDVVGGSALADNVGMLNEGGRLVIIGTLGGASGELPIGQLMAKRARVIGSTLRARPVENKAAILEATRHLVWPLLASGALQIPIHDRLPLEEAARAHELLRAGGHLGKVVLEVEAPSDGHRRGRRRRGA
jgi:NADPH:quinone reductase-like Zn-dependent oxidoreductase